MGNIENALANLKDMVANYVTAELSMFSGREVGGSAKMSNGPRDIEKSNANEGYIADLGEGVGELENRLSISDKITNAELMK